MSMEVNVSEGLVSEKHAEFDIYLPVTPVKLSLGSLSLLVRERLCTISLRINRCRTRKSWPSKSVVGGLRFLIISAADTSVCLHNPIASCAMSSKIAGYS